MASRRTPGHSPTSPWDRAFTAIDNATNPYWKYVPVQQSNVDGLPPGFSLSTDWGVTKLYRQDVARDTYTIRELGPLYYVGKEAYHPDVYPEEHKEHDRPRALVAGGLAAAGTLLAAGAAGELLSSSSDEETARSPPRLAYAAQRLDDKQYNVFISHSWTHDDHYRRIEDFLDEVQSLQWQNHSVPSTDPLPVETDEALEDALRNQMRTAAVVIVSAGMYTAHSTWIERELDLADELGKPVVAIIPHGADRRPQTVLDAADEVVGWQQSSLIDALATYG